MRVAIPVWSGRISPVLDSAQHLVCIDFDSSGEQKREFHDWRRCSFCGRMLAVVDLGIDVMLCGSLSRPCLWMLKARGVEVRPFLCGDYEAVVDVWRDHPESMALFNMPGAADLFNEAADRCWINWFSDTDNR